MKKAPLHTDMIVSEKSIKLNHINFFVSMSEMIALSRKRLKLSQDDLAKLSCMSRNYISMIERGYIHNVSLGTMLNICDVLGIEIYAETKTDEKGENHEL